MIKPGRAHKRLLYLVLIWTCVCFVAFRVTFTGNNSPNSDRPSVAISGGRKTSYVNWDDYFSSFQQQHHPSLSNNRGLLQNDYSVLQSSNNNNNPSSEAIISSQFLESQQQVVSNQAESNEGSYQVVLDVNHPAIDSSPALSEQDLLLSLSNDSNNDNLALQYWSRLWRNKSKTPKGSCRPEFPSLFDIDYNNVHWQRFVSSAATNNSIFYLYASYYDDRWRGGPLPMVRILSMIDRVTPPLVHCLLWFEEFTTPVMSQASYVYGWYPKWGNYADGHLQPFIITCKVPRIKGLPKTSVPSSVSIVETKCDKISNNLRVKNQRPKVKQRFAVCVKGLDFLYEDMSVRLVEWLELLRLLGASKIFLYDLEVHPNITKVINHYSRQGLVEVTRITLPGSQPNIPGLRHLYLKKKLTDKRQNELIPYNDCLYRNLYSYEYLALLDIDEIIMPLKHDNWSDMMDEVIKVSLQEKNFTRASYNFRNVYFLDDVNSDPSSNGEHETGHESNIPPFLHMMQHVYRSRNYTKPGQYVKCFHNTERVVSLHNHFPLNCFGRCTTFSIPTDLAQLQHYRKDCVGPLRKTCKDFRVNTVRDTTIWKYRDPLIQRAFQALNDMHFFHQHKSSSLDSSSLKRKKKK